MMAFLKKIPGFRSGTKWKMAVAVFVYLSIISGGVNDLINGKTSTPTVAPVVIQPKSADASKPAPQTSPTDATTAAKTPEQIAKENADAIAEQKATDDAIDAQVAQNKADYEAKNKAYADAESQKLATLKSDSKSIPYKDLARNPDTYTDTKVKYTGKVIQVQEDGGTVALLVNVTKDSNDIYTDTMVVSYDKGVIKGRVLEDDIISLWGTFTGLVTYKTVLGADATTPQVVAQIMELNN